MKPKLKLDTSFKSDSNRSLFNHTPTSTSSTTPNSVSPRKSGQAFSPKKQLTAPPYPVSDVHSPTRSVAPAHSDANSNHHIQKAKSHVNPHSRRTSMQGPSLAERLALLAESGKFGDPNTSRFSMRSSSAMTTQQLSNSESKTQNLHPKQRQNQHTDTTSKKQVQYHQPSTLAKPSNVQKHQHSRSNNHTHTAAKPFHHQYERQSSSAQKYFAATLASSSSHRKIQLSKLTDSEFYKLMGVTRKTFDKLPVQDKVELKQAKNAI